MRISPVYMQDQANRSALYLRVGELAARLRACGRAPSFVLDHLSMWRGPLAPVPSWLRDGARRFEGQCAETAALLHDEADLEELHRRALATDLAELEANPTWEQTLRDWEPSVAVERHMFVRTMVSSEDPMMVVAIDHHHAVLDMVLARALLYGLRGQLPGRLHARHFIEARAADAKQRAQSTKVALDRGARRCADEARVSQWRASSADVIETYLAALESFVVQPRRSLSPGLRAAARSGPALRL